MINVRGISYSIFFHFLPPRFPNSLIFAPLKSMNLSPPLCWFCHYEVHSLGIRQVILILFSFPGIEFDFCSPVLSPCVSRMFLRGGLSRTPSTKKGQSLSLSCERVCRLSESHSWRRGQRQDFLRIVDSWAKAVSGAEECLLWFNKHVPDHVGSWQNVSLQSSV